MTPDARIGETVQMRSPVRIRAARKAELAGIEEVFLLSARDGWREIFGAERLEALPREGLPEWDLEGVSVLVAVREPELVGFASCGPAYGEHEAASVGKLYRLFVVPQEWGSGVGSRLLASSTKVLREAGFTSAVLWVGETNSSARALYEREGWKLNGGHRRREFLGGAFAEVRYRTDLARAAR
jgi:GNAT superfamily N-acetyltransferase